MMYREKVNAWIDAHRQDYIDMLTRWVRIPSIKSDAEINAPFGPELRRMLDTAAEDIRALGFPVRIFDGYAMDATLGLPEAEPVAVLEAALAANDGKEYDISICCVNVEACEMSAILPVREGGIVYFFSMATSFTRAALGAEGVGKDITMIIGNGYAKDHAEITLNVLRENKKLRELFDKKYV